MALKGVGGFQDEICGEVFFESEFSDTDRMVNTDKFWLDPSAGIVHFTVAGVRDEG